MSLLRSKDQPSAPVLRELPPTSGARLPDVAAMRRFVLSEAVCGRDGSVYSWSNPSHPGYPYPEAGGLFLSLLCGRRFEAGENAATIDGVAAWLCQSLSPEGGVGRAGTMYLFDSAVVLAGLLRYRAATGNNGADAAIHRLRGFICERIGGGCSVLPGHAANDGRWSTQFGAHLLKSLHSLHLYELTFGERLAAPLVSALINRSGHQPSPVYVHPFCYEQEGHLVVAHYGLGNLFEPLEGAADWLAALQQPDGGILAFANGMDGFGEPRSDATAQAVRLWLLGGRARYHESIVRALSFLAGCQTSSGGILYTPARSDVCSWSTMFTLQAVEWFVGQPRIDDIL